MEKSFDLGSLLRQHQKKHKSKPTQFASVAGGVRRRLEKSILQRKSTRLTAFDCTRNLPVSSPVHVSEAKQKAERRRQQLQKWKEEKEIKKKELATKKIKPFITGIPHNPMKYVPPPPARPLPSASGCVTRSRARNQKEESKKVPESFAPHNAGFRAPKIKSLVNLPTLEASKNKNSAPECNFQPIMPPRIAITTRSQAYQRIAAESRAKAGKAKEMRPIKGPPLKPASKPHSELKTVQTSSSSENESHMHTSTSSSDVDFTAKVISSSECSNILSSTDNDSSKSLQSLSSCEFISEKQSSIEKPKLRPTSQMKTRTPRKSTQAIQESTLNTPRNPIPKSESSSEEKLRSPKSLDVPMTPEQIAEEFKKISPCVTMSRGKDNARKEMKKKIAEGLLDEDASDMDGIEHFQRQLASEIKRMTEICETWDQIYEKVSLPESVQGLVLGAVGQARLLMSQKMQQFAQLVQRCARPEPGATLVTPADLRGFWDMVFLQVENLDMRFKELEELKARNWVEECTAPAPAARRPRAARAPPARPRAGPPSRLRDMIAAARKAKAQEAVQEGTPKPPEPIQPVVFDEACSRTFEAGFFCVRSPGRSPRTPHTPRNKQNLLKAVLSSEAEKASASKKSASFAMLRASVLSKGVECEGVAPLPPTPLPQVNLHATPGRSILKQPQENSIQSSKSTIKQIKIVLFDQSDNEMENTSTEDLNLSKEHIRCNETVTENKELPREQKHIDTNNALSIVDMDEKELTPRVAEKENSRSKSKLIRQDAVTTETPTVMTRRMRKSTDAMQKERPNSDQKTPPTDKKTTKRSTRKKVQAEVETNQTSEIQDTQQTEENTPRSEKKTPRRSLRNKVQAEVEEIQTPQTDQKSPDSEKKTAKRSTRKKVLTEVESNIQNENYLPMRSTRRKKSGVI